MSAASARALSSAARISAAAFSASARSCLADSSASAMVFSRVSIIWRTGPQANLPRTTIKSAKVTVVQTTNATLMSVRPAATSMLQPPRGRELTRKAPGPRAQVRSGLGGQDDADHLGEQRDAFDEGGRDDHGGADVAARRRLARGPFHGRRAHLPDAESGAEQGEPDAEACSQVPERGLVHVTP